MNDSLPVRSVEGVGDLDAEAQDLVERKRPFREPRREGLPLEVLHHEVVRPVLVSHVEESADVRVRQGGDGASLLLEPLPRLAASGPVGDHHLEGDAPVEPRVTRPVHLSHPSGSEKGDDLVRAETCPGDQAHGVDVERSGMRPAAPSAHEPREKPRAASIDPS